MNKFIENLKRLSQAAPEPIGFRARQVSTATRKIQVLASLSGDDSAGPAAAAASADALLFRLDGYKPGKVPEPPAGLPWGVLLGNVTREGVEEMTKSGCDFVVFPSDAPVASLDDTPAGKILEVEASLSDGLVRTIGQLPVDAVLVSPGQGEDEPLTLKHLMLVQRFAGMPGKPLLVSASASITGSELLALWGAGVDCLVVESSSKTQDKMKQLRQTIDGLTFPVPRRREKLAPVLPPMGGQPGVTPPDEEEEEEEE